MIKTEQLQFQYRSEDPMCSFPDINLKDQEELLILGKSGIGKTTFLHLLSGLLEPTKGSVVIENTVLNTLGTSEMDKFRGQTIGLVFQKNHAVRSLTVYENLKARLLFSKRKIDVKAIDAVLDDLGLRDLKNRKTNALSEGQLQRVGIALAVIHQPKVIFADEPTGNLDKDNSINTLSVLIKNQEITLVYKFKFLGVTVDNKLSFTYHISNVSSKISRSCSILFNLSHFLPQQTLKKLYYSIMYLFITYVIEVWANLAVRNSIE